MVKKETKLVAQLITKWRHFQNCTVLIFIITCITGIRATFDWSNLDLVNFEYFKYPRTTAKPFYLKRRGVLYSIRQIPDPPTKLEDTTNRAKAVVTYFKNLLLGNPNERTESRLDPAFGEKWSETFQAKHGKFGEALVNLLGEGASHDVLVESGAIDHWIKPISSVFQFRLFVSFKHEILFTEINFLNLREPLEPPTTFSIVPKCFRMTNHSQGKGSSIKF